MVILEAQIDKAANQLDAADARIRDFAGRPDLTATGLTRLAAAGRADRPVRRGRGDLPGASPPEPPADPNQFQLVKFLARRGRIKEAIDLCETLWADPALREQVAAVCVEDPRPTPMPPSTRSRPNASSAGSSEA